LTDATSPGPERARRTRSPIPLSPMAAIVLAIAIGLACGYLDLLMVIVKKYWWSDLGHFETARDFPWSIPVAHVVLLLVPGLLLAAMARLRPGGLSLRAGTWLLSTLALWMTLLRAPLYGAAVLILAAGLARPMSGAIAHCIAHNPSRARPLLAVLFAVLILLATLSSGREAVREHFAVGGLAPSSPDARNVVLIVWDTVRASSLSLSDYPRITTPNLARWARTGVRFTRALAPAPWTFASHGCFFTGRWPYSVDLHSNNVLDTADPTLAEYLASRGYQTAGFAANTNYCSYEGGLNRGFTHYEDYPLTPLSLLGRTVPGSWILKNIVSSGDFHEQKWIRLQSRDARGINSAFIDWLRVRRQDHPFFAFLNYFDAHDPYVPPPEYAGRFGIRPDSPRDYHFLTDFAHLKTSVAARDVMMARDCYDDCISFLDDQLGRLLETLKGQGLLDHTLVIITSDHGESFGVHGIFGHGGSLYLDEVAVPLVILSPGVTASVVADPVSLRDLPATVVDELGLAPGSRFPGHSLSTLWRSIPGQADSEKSPAFSEIAHPTAFEPQEDRGLSRRGVQMSLVASGRHYIRDGSGTERIYDLRTDPYETNNLIGSAPGDQCVVDFRRMLLKLLTDSSGSIAVENAYLKAYRQSLKSLVEQRQAAHVAVPSLDNSAVNRRG
jgi:arylsulfatase A-like enzyme